MRVFMLGWEFPPFISGGLGTACYGLTRGLDEIGVEVVFVLPKAVPIGASQHVKVRTPSDADEDLLAWEEDLDGDERFFEHVEVHRLEAKLQAYANPTVQEQSVRKLVARQQQLRRGKGGKGAKNIPAAKEAPLPSGMFVQGGGTDYAGDMMGQVRRYAQLASHLAAREEFDVVHAHDWMTYPAGLAVAHAAGKPLVVHVHSTEFDRSGQNINQWVYDIERAGMHGAAGVVCVSHLTRNIVTGRYGVPKNKVTVVYNAVELPNDDAFVKPIRHNEKLVLFLGRITMQKGPEYFLQAARKVIAKLPNVRFVMAGSGDMISQCIHLATDLKIGSHVTFTGFLRGSDVARIMRMADLYVMPSVSEPFGIAPLEAMSHDVPVIISKQSGVSEVLSHALKVDFWDIDEMANKILAVLRHPPLQRTLRQHGQIELRKFSWRDSAKKLKKVYTSVIGPGRA